MSEWGQFVTIDHMEQEIMDNKNIFNNKHYCKSSTCNPRISTIYEDQLYDDIVRTYSSEFIPPAIINKQNKYAQHPILSITYLFYYCLHKFWN